MNNRDLARLAPFLSKASFTSPDLGAAVSNEEPVAKPYDSNSDLPQAVRDALPESAQTVWREAYNAGLSRFGDEGRASQFAWGAVKQSWKKNPEGTWVRKQAKPEDGVCVALWLDAETADQLSGAFPDEIAQTPETMHVTLAYLGVKKDFEDAQLEELTATVGEFAELQVGPLGGAYSGIGRFFGEKDAIYASLSAPALAEFREHLVRHLRDFGFEADDTYGFYPHTTLAYVDPKDRVAIDHLEPIPVEFSGITVGIGPDLFHYGFSAVADAPEDPVPVEEGRRRKKPHTYTYGIAKASEEKRYTFGPVYLPGVLDAHNEFIEDDDLHQSIWDYVRKGDRSVHLQHSEKVVGEFVEIVRWPYRASATLSLPDGKGGFTQQRMTFPAGTVYMGTIWNEETWPLVKTGAITGYSIGGKALRTEVEFA